MGLYYKQWINGNCGCDCGNNYSKIDKCDCDAILLDISNLKTDVTVLSGDIETLSAEVDTKLDASAYTPVDLTDYYTKEEVDELVSGGTAVDAYTKAESDERFQPIGNYLSGNALNGYATEQWVLDKHYISGVDLSDYALKSEIPTVPTNVSAFNNDAGYINQLKTINGESLIGEGNIQIGEGGTIDAYTKEEADNRFALKSELSGFVETSTLIQYISNLQEQITSIINAISGCCGETGETQYRWITMTGENDYWCDGTNKYTKEKQQSSTDGIVWTDTGNYRKGVLIETDSADCGYVPVVSNKITVNYINGDEISKECDGSTVLRNQNFSNWENISGATVGDCITEIGDLAFYGFSGLTSISLPNTITKIGGSSFSHCVDLPSVSIPSGVTEIGRQAFGYCYSLQSVNIPSGVTEILNGTFYYCSGLTSVTLSNATQKIGVNAFGKCAFSTITIPSTVEEIGEYAFSYNPNLTYATVNATTPPTLVDDNGSAGSVQRNIFIGCNILSAIYVPAASVEAYKAANGWSAYASIIQGV